MAPAYHLVPCVERDIFNLEKVRNQTWSVAEQLSSLDDNAQARVLEELDRETLKVGLPVKYPDVSIS